MSKYHRDYRRANKETLKLRAVLGKEYSVVKDSKSEELKKQEHRTSTILNFIHGKKD